MEFRKKFILEEIPKRIAPEDDLATRLVLAGWVLGDFMTTEEFATRHQIPEVKWNQNLPVMKHILAMPLEEVMAELLRLATDTLHEFQDEVLLEASRSAGIDLAAEWQLSEDYLKRKQKAELIALGEELGTWADPAVQEFITATLKEKSGDPNHLKKGGLIQCFMGDHYDRRGKVPQEILAGE
jgi:ParB family chromosome partitioning protein